MAKTCKIQLGSLDTVNFAIDAVSGLTINQLATKYSITKKQAETLLKSPRVAQVAAIANKTLLSAAQESLNMCLPQIQEMTTRYIAEALKEDRIDSSSLTSLFTVWNTVMDKMLKVHEVTLKQQELDAKQEELKQAKSGTAGLMSQFLETLRMDSSLDDVPTIDAEVESKEESDE